MVVKIRGISGIILLHAQAGRPWRRPHALGDPLPCSGCTACHSRAETPRTLQVAVIGPHRHRVVVPSHLWGQQRMPNVAEVGMGGTIVSDVGMGGTTSVHWLHWLGHAVVVAQRA